MSRSKQQGTAAETRIVALHRDRGIQARRLAEGGRADEGDVEVLAPSGRLVGEVKDRERLSLHDTLATAERKAGTHRVAVFWTRRSATTQPRCGVAALSAWSRSQNPSGWSWSPMGHPT